MKDFDRWNMLKKKVHEVSGELFVKPREIWFAQLGVNVGNEEDGKGNSFKRPVLILQKVGNMFLAAPMTTKGKDNRYYYTLQETYFGGPSRVILSQIRMIDKKRLTHKLAILSESDFMQIKQKLKALLL